MLAGTQGYGAFSDSSEVQFEMYMTRVTEALEWHHLLSEIHVKEPTVTQWRAV
jgi:hypothetical protein